MARKQYGHDWYGNPIQPEPGYKIVPEFHSFPEPHRVYTWTGRDHRWIGFRCHNTMTPIWARVSGWDLAFAVPEDVETTELHGAREALVNFKGVF